VARRLLVAVLTLLGLSLLVFVLASVVGDPSEAMATSGSADAQATPEQIAALRHELGLDRPLLVRYSDWLGKALKGDLGKSFYGGRDVAHEIRKAFPVTLLLAVAAFTLIVALAIPMGVLGALFHRRWGDQVIRGGALLAASVPGFFLAYVLINFFAVKWHLFPVSGLTRPRSVVLPAFTLAAGPAAMVSRLLRSSLLDTLGEDYIRTARAKGLAALPVMVNHAIRNAALPVITVLGSIFGRLLEGAVIVEVVFAWRGLGLLTYNAVTSYDYPLVVGTVLVGGTIFVTLNLAVDLIYVLIDPRIRLGAAR
jgi:peptide/nickel transport system permease protein